MVFDEKIQNDGTYKLRMNKAAVDLLDSSEKTAINYWLGMFFATLLAQKIYGYKYAIHYSKFIKSKLAVIKNNTKAKNVSPDLITMNKFMDKYGVFEAKGGFTFRRSRIEHAYDQVHKIKSINKESNIDRIVSYFRIREKNSLLRIKDPEGKEIALKFDQCAAIIWQYIPVIELIHECEYGIDGEEIYSSLDLIEGLNGIKINRQFYKVVNNIREIMINDDSESSIEGYLSEATSIITSIVNKEIDLGIAAF